jgi:hypothetical protein
VDSKTKNIVWKGTASNSIYKSQNESKAIAKFVDDMFANIQKSLIQQTSSLEIIDSLNKIRKQIIHTKINTINFFTIITIVTTFMFSSSVFCPSGWTYP